ncbi:MAG TPA: hypothetical protein VMD59_13320 [Acidimicrobiales bacterium]|nr:hypothetical protein [Acidimicrobiales bacterium]
MHRAGELVVIAIPRPLEEAVRDRCRARADMVEDLTRARNRLGKFLLRHSVIWRGASNWTLKHRRFIERASSGTACAAAHLLALPRSPRRPGGCARRHRARPRRPSRGGSLSDTVKRLACYSSVDRLGALRIASEVCDFGRFGRAEQLRGFTGLVPGEHARAGAATSADSPRPAPQPKNVR